MNTVSLIVRVNLTNWFQIASHEAETGSHGLFPQPRELLSRVNYRGNITRYAEVNKNFRSANINAGCHAKVWRVNTLQFSAFRIQFIYYWPVPVLMSALCLFISKLSGERPIYFSCDIPPSAIYPYLITTNSYLRSIKYQVIEKKKISFRCW